MAILIDGPNKNIVLSETSNWTFHDIYVAIQQWAAQSDNMQYTLPCIGNGKISIGNSVYTDSIFILNHGWKLMAHDYIHMQDVSILGTLITIDGSSRIRANAGDVEGSEVIWTFQVSSQGIITNQGNITSIQPSVISQIVASGNQSGWDGNKSVPELSSDPGSSPSLNQMSMLNYMELRNKKVQGDPTASGKYYYVHNDANQIIASGVIYDDANLNIFTKEKLQW